MATEDFLAIAHILRPQGRKGEVLAELLTDLIEQFEAGRILRLAKAPDAPYKEHTLEAHWLPVGKNAGRIVLKFSDVNSISEAEALAKLDVLVAASELPALDEDTFYVRDLIDCELVDGDKPLGKITDVQFATSADGKVRLEDAAPILEVDIAGSEEPVLIPFVKAYLDRVDLSAKQIIMNLPEGLILRDPSHEE